MLSVALNLRTIATILGALSLVGGVWYVHQRAYNRGQAEIQAKWDKEKAIQQAAYDKSVLDTERLRQDLELANWRLTDAVKQKLAADDRSATLARRLREAYARQAELPESVGPADPAGPPGAGTGDEGTRLDTAVQRVISACRADSIRLEGWQSWYRNLPDELKDDPFPIMEPAPSPEEVIENERLKREAVFGMFRN